MKNSRDYLKGITLSDTNKYVGKGSKRKRLTIVHVTAYYIPGLGYQENFLPFEQGALGHNVHIITGNRLAPHPSYNTVYEPMVGPRKLECGTEVERNVTIHRLSVLIEIRRHNSPWIRGSVSLLNKLGPDIVHLHGVTPWTSLQIMFSPAAQRHRIVCDHHLCRFNLTPFTVAKRVYYAGFRLFGAPLAQRRVSSWMPINEDAEEVLGTVLGIKGENIVINRLGVDTAHFGRDRKSGLEWRHTHNISLNSTLIVHAGRLEPRKKTEDLLAAFAFMFTEGDKIEKQLILVGDGDPNYIQMLKALAASLNISDSTKFLAMQPHDALPALFNAADIGVWPGDAAITLIEAMGCGLPIVLSAPPGLSYVGQCPGAYIWQDGDAAGLAKILTHLSFKKPDREDIARNCAEQLSWQSIAVHSLNIYYDVIAQTSAPK